MMVTQPEKYKLAYAMGYSGLLWYLNIEQLLGLSIKHNDSRAQLRVIQFLAKIPIHLSRLWV